MPRGMDRAIDLATQEATRSVETFRLGAALLVGGKVVAAGRNRNANSAGLRSVHAEASAVWRAGKAGRARADRAHVVVVRIGAAGFACARPCAACMRALARWGVRGVTYTTGDPDRPLDRAVPCAA